MLLERHVISAGEFSRTVWYHAGPQDKSHPLCIFLDAEHYLRDMDARPVLEELLGEHGMPPLSLLFVSHVSSDPTHADYACRMVDYTCNAGYAKFIAEDVMQWAQDRNIGIRPARNVICGLSLSGLQSAYLALQYSRVFSSSLSQSGSFWWLSGQNIPLPATRAKFWLSVGDQETAEGVSHSPDLFQKISQIAGVEQFAEEIGRLGGTVHYHKYSGGHAPAPWRAELTPALRWLLTS
jgi:enterochelin esterase-like enzyme